MGVWGRNISEEFFFFILFCILQFLKEEALLFFVKQKY